MSTISTAQAYKHCQKVTASHYENFPVASVLLPKKLRKPVSVIYTFARLCDDYADEGKLSAQERYRLLDEAKNNLLDAANNKAHQDPLYVALADTLQLHPGLTNQLLKLLEAFNQDVEKNRYNSFGEVIDYCKHSANPIGHMLLVLFKADSQKNIAFSDAVCSALQIINFLQDIQSDYLQRNRIYMPADEMDSYQLTETDFGQGTQAAKLSAFMDFQIQRAFKLLQSGAPLGLALKGRVGLELRMVILGGWMILKKLNDSKGEISIQTRLEKKDWLWIISRALSSRFIIYLKKLSPISTAS